MENEFGPHFHVATFTDSEGRLRTTRVPVAQELARSGNLNHLPDKFITIKDPICQSYKSPPVINVARLRKGAETRVRAAELARLAAGVKEWGLFLLTEHGISVEALDGVRDAVKGYFGLSFEEKKMCVGSYPGVDNMGYGQNFVRWEDQKVDWIDRLCMKAAPRGADEGLDVWPKKPANFRQNMKTYVSEARNLLDELLKALAEALSLERHAFLNQFDPLQSEIKVRVNYYPPCPGPDPALGISPHTDGSGVTLLMELDSTGGLQVLKDQKWITIPWPKDTLMVNIGDLLEIISNGRVKSPWHRAIAHSGSERISVALFYNPPSIAEIVPIEDVGNGKDGYKKVKVGEYLQYLYKVSPSKEKVGIIYAKT